MINILAFGFGAPIEWIVIAAVALLLLGPKKLPELARSLGRSAGELKKGLDETKEQFKDSLDSAASTTPEPTVAKEVSTEKK